MGDDRPDTARGELSLPSADLTGDLAALVTWARADAVDLTGLEVGPPSGKAAPNPAGAVTRPRRPARRRR